MGQACGKTDDVVDEKQHKNTHGKKRAHKGGAASAYANDRQHHDEHPSTHGKKKDDVPGVRRCGSSKHFEYIGHIEALQHTMKPSVPVVSGDHLLDDFRQFTDVYPPHTAALSVVSCKAANMPHHVLTSGEDCGIALINYETGHVLRRWMHAHEKDINRLTRPLSNGVFATASRDRTVKVWNLAKDSPLAELQGHALNVSAVDVHPNRELAVSGSKDNTVRLWDIEQQMELYCGDVKLNIVHFVKFMPSLSCVAQGGEDLTLRLWDVRGAGRGMTLELTKTFEGMDYYPVCSEVLPSKPYSLLTGHNGVNGCGSYISEWDLRVGKCVCMYNGHKGTVSGIAADEKGVYGTDAFLSCSDDGSIGLWHRQEAKEQVELSENNVFAVPEGKITGMDCEDNGDVITSLSTGCLVVFRSARAGGVPNLRYRYVGVMQQE